MKGYNMKLYFNKIDKNEYLNLNGGELPNHVVELPSDNVFWSQIPSDKKLVYENDIPVGLEDLSNDFHIQSKIQETSNKRDELLKSDIEYRGSMFQCDDVSVRNMTVRLAGIENGEIITWRASDNTNHQFSDGDLESMLKIIGERGDQIYRASWMVKADIEAHINPASLDIAERFAYHLEQINA